MNFMTNLKKVENLQRKELNISTREVISYIRSLFNNGDSVQAHYVIDLNRANPERCFINLKYFDKLLKKI